MKGQAIGYMRVSSIDQNEARQREGFAAANITLNKEFIDKVSGKDKERPALRACLEYAREGDTIYIYSIDRLARNLRDLQDILESATAQGINVHFLSESLHFSTTNTDPMSKLLLHIMGAFAEFERVIIKERQREGIAIAKLKGTKTGKPFGKQPLDMSRRVEAIELSKQGNNISEIARAMGLSRASIYKLLGEGI